MNSDIKVTDASGATVATGIALSTKEKIGQNQVAVTFQPAVTADGEYTVSIGKGSLLIGENGDSNNAIEVKYTVSEHAFDPADPKSPYDNRGVKIYPEQGTYKSINSFLLTFDCEKTGINYSPMVKVYDDETGDVFGTCWVDYGANFGREVTADVLPYMNVPGVYTLVFPKGTFYEYGREDKYEPEMPILKFRYIIDPAGKELTTQKENVTADPVSGSEVMSLKTINITFPDYSLVDRSHIVDNLNNEIEVKNVSTGECVSVGAVNPSKSGLASNTMQIKFDPEVIEGGNYEIVFARRVFLLGEEGDRRFNEEFKLNYGIKTSGIATVDADASAGVTIFTLDGVEVANANEPGVYIMIDSKGKARKLVR